jgi:hypothetical protein
MSLSTFSDRDQRLSNTRTTTTSTTIPVQTPDKAQSALPLTCPISDLPYELRQLIYARYLAILPPLRITPTTLRRLPHPALLRSSPLFARDIAPPLFYQRATFSFNCVADLLLFARPPHGHHVRKIRILSPHDRKGGDWVYSAQKCFPGLEEMVFEFAEDQEMHWDLDGWWETVLDAVREGRAGGGRRKRRELRLSVEGGEGINYSAQVL